MIFADASRHWNRGELGGSVCAAYASVDRVRVGWLGYWESRRGRSCGFHLGRCCTLLRTGSMRCAFLSRARVNGGDSQMELQWCWEGRMEPGNKGEGGDGGVIAVAVRG